jgi:aspartate--ammonia ligase
VNFLKEIGGTLCAEPFPHLRVKKYPNRPDKLTFLHAEDLLKMYPDLPRE